MNIRGREAEQALDLHGLPLADAVCDTARELLGPVETENDPGRNGLAGWSLRVVRKADATPLSTLAVRA